MTTMRVTREDGTAVDEVAWQAAELEVVEKVNGPAAAALIAAGIGAFVLGLFTTWNEASTGMHDFLEMDKDVGPLSGKTIMAVVAYVVSWGILAPLMWKRALPWNTILIITAVLIAAGFIGTFPKFFEQFASD
jgi:hypothetical protein